MENFFMTLSTADHQVVFLKINKMVDQMRTFFVRKNNETDLEIIEKIEVNLSPLHTLTRLAVDYRQQVSNGGHKQYLENGYHSTFQNGSLDNVSQEDDLLQKFISLLKQHLSILDCENDTQLIIDALSNIEIKVNDQEYQEETCNTCYGNCSQEVSNPEYDANDEDNSEQEFIEEDCSDCNSTGRNEDAYNDNYGKLLESTLKQCKEADNIVYDSLNTLINSIADKSDNP